MTVALNSEHHRERPSLLSSTSGYVNYRGFLNLVYVILGIGSSHLVLENILKYGLLVEFDWPLRFLKDPTNWPSVLLVSLLHIFIVFQYWLEIKLIKRLFNRFLTSLQIINLSFILIFPVIYIDRRQPNAAGAFIAVCLYSIVFLKLVSYAHVNYQCRIDLFNKKVDKINSDTKPQDSISYPNNLTLKNLYYFLLAPTLCYELNFPRSPCIRKVFLFRRFGEILVICSLQYCLSQQWLLPILRTLDRPLNQYSVLENVERLLRLALPNHLIWLLLFYVYFHSTLNLLAELLCFGDRLFYRDWWNATDLHEFWNRWNKSVHDFCKRHVYNPLVNHFGLSKSMSSFVVFVLSAFFHEYIISVPLRMIRPWSFLAMILQVPMGVAVKRIKNENKTYGNIAVWISLILIQPIAILLYIQDLFYRDFIQH